MTILYFLCSIGVTSLVGMVVYFILFIISLESQIKELKKEVRFLSARMEIAEEKGFLRVVK